MTTHAGETGQWDRYWAYGNIHSFSQVASGNYGGAVAEFWRGCFRRLGPGSRVVDIATGNGAIALLALEESDRLSRGFEICGVDLADIDPVGCVKDRSLAESLKRIRFIGRTPVESLPFEDASVDMACSQFGLEYGDTDRAVPEVARILVSGGRLAVVAHHEDSVLLHATREELRQLDFVLNEVKLYLRARNLLRALADAEPGGGRGQEARANPKIGKKRRALQEAMGRIHEAAGRQPNPNMLLGPARYVHEIFAAADRAAPVELLQWLEEALQRVTANRRRLVDMTEAARGADDLRTLAGQLEASGFDGIEHGLFHGDDGRLLGWRVEARKR